MDDRLSKLQPGLTVVIPTVPPGNMPIPNNLSMPNNPPNPGNKLRPNNSPKKGNMLRPNNPPNPGNMLRPNNRPNPVSMPIPGNMPMPRNMPIPGNLPQPPNMAMPGNMPIPASVLNVPNNLFPQFPSDFQRNNPQFPVPPKFPQPPNYQMFPNPPPNGIQAYPNLLISSSEPSFSMNNRVPTPQIQLKRIGMDSNIISSNYQNGNLDLVQNRFPQVKINVNNAGFEQNYLTVEGDSTSVSIASSMLSSLNSNEKVGWRFLNILGDFIKYTKLESELIEESFSNGKTEVELEVKTEVELERKSYTIFFGQNGNPHTQLSKKSSTYRLVRRGTKALQLNYAQDDIIWYWSDEITNQFKQYEPEASKLIECYYQKFLQESANVQLNGMKPDKRKVYAKNVSTLVSGTSGWAYMMDFVNMVQINEKTERWRGIRRGEQGGVLRVSQRNPEPVPWIPHPILK